MKSILRLLLLTAAPLAAQELACETDVGLGAGLSALDRYGAISSISIYCRGGSPTPIGTPIPQYTIRLSLNTNITSRLTAAPYSEALLAIDHPAPADQRYCTDGAGCVVLAGQPNAPNIFQARQTSANTLTFSGIPIDPPGPGAYRVLKFVNVRADATTLPDSSHWPIRALISISGPSFVPLAGNQLAAAWVSPSYAPSVLSGLTAHRSCEAVNTTNAPTTSFRFVQNFAGSFRRRTVAAQVDLDSSPPPAPQNDTRTDYFTASGFFNPTPNIVSGPDTNLASAGLAEHGTRLVARFKNVPPGVVLTAALYSSNPTMERAARLVRVNPDGTGPFSAAPNGNIPIVDGVGTAVWEVVGSIPHSQNFLDFEIGISYPAGVATGDITAATGIAPLSPTAPDKPLFAIVPCTVSSVSPTYISVRSTGDTAGTVSFTAPGPWTATSSVPWISITSPATGSGSGTVIFDVAPNRYPGSRGGTIRIDGWPVNIYQEGESDLYKVSPTGRSVSPEAGSGTFSISPPDDVSWTISNTSTFFSVSPMSGTGPSVITYSYTANSGSFGRSATAFIDFGNSASALFSLTQQGVPKVPVVLSPASDTVPMAGVVARSISVSADARASWSALSSTPELTILSGTSGSGNGTITYSVSPAPNNLSRTHWLYIEDQVMRVDQGGPTTVETGASTGSGTSKTFTFRFTHPNGAASLDVVNALINTALDGNNACYLAYSRPNRVLYLVNDGGPGSGLSAGLPLGSTGSVSNSQCTVFSEGSSASESGQQLTLNVNIRFEPAFAGAKVVYLAARDATGGNSGWFTQGVWNVPGAPISYPRLASFTAPLNFQFGSDINPVLVFEDQSDANNLETVWALVNTAVDGRVACYVAYHVPSNRLYLVPDNGDGSQAISRPWTYPDFEPLENSQCRITPNAEVVKSGNRLYLPLALYFKRGFFGPRAVWTAAQTLSGKVSPWTVSSSVSIR